MGHPENSIEQIQVVGIVLQFEQVVVELLDHFEGFDQKVF